MKISPNTTSTEILPARSCSASCARRFSFRVSMPRAGEIIAYTASMSASVRSDTGMKGTLQPDGRLVDRQPVVAGLLDNLNERLEVHRLHHVAVHSTVVGLRHILFLLG